MAVMNTYHEPLNCLPLSITQSAHPSPLIPYALSLIASISPPHLLSLSAQPCGGTFSSGSYNSDHKSGGD